MNFLQIFVSLHLSVFYYLSLISPLLAVTSGHDLVDIVVLRWCFGLVILGVFSELHGSVVLLYDSIIPYTHFISSGFASLSFALVGLGLVFFACWVFFWGFVVVGFFVLFGFVSGWVFFWGSAFLHTQQFLGIRPPFTTPQTDILELLLGFEKSHFSNYLFFNLSSSINPFSPIPLCCSSPDFFKSLSDIQGNRPK